MSGIVGLLHLDGSRVDRDLHRALTDFLSYRGPDRSETWANGEIALGHAALFTSPESRARHQPATLGGIFTIVADVRLDARGELIARLSSGPGTPPPGASDADLILHSYARWGEDCVARLVGDFSFAIWDARARSLFCARDHFGIKPFYFAELPGRFIFSNTLDCVRLHPELPGDLDEESIGDFLLFGLNCNASTTAFRAIRRLPPAHCLTVFESGVRSRCYWSPPIDGRIRYRHPQEHVEHYQSLLREAVSDRLHCDRAGILLSGGLDSASIAATAREITSSRQNSCDLRAYTIVPSESREDVEKSHALETATFLRIPLEMIPLDHLRPFDRGGDEQVSWPEPVNDPFFFGLFHQFRRIAGGCRVVLDGEGSDNLMHFEMWPYVKDMVRRFEWRDLVSTVPPYLRLRGSIWPGIRRRIREAGGRHPEALRYPEWLNPEFALRTRLQERFHESNKVKDKSTHPVLPVAHASLSLPHWTHLFENANAGVTRVPVDVRYPFLDLRLVKFVLSMPPYPWLYKKALLREAMAGKLPEVVRSRPKTALKEDPLLANLKHPISEYVKSVQWIPEIERFVQRDAMMSALKEDDSFALPFAIRPVCLNFWLQCCTNVRYKLKAEAHNG